MSGPLDGVVVVDLSRALAGPHAAMMLGDLGARVIKVESPNGGDDTRGYGPPFVGPDDEPVSTYYLSANRNKESITLDLKAPDGQEVLTRLVRHGEVLQRTIRSYARNLPPAWAVIPHRDDVFHAGRAWARRYTAFSSS